MYDNDESSHGGHAGRCRGTETPEIEGLGNVSSENAVRPAQRRTTISVDSLDGSDNSSPGRAIRLAWRTALSSRRPVDEADPSRRSTICFGDPVGMADLARRAAMSFGPSVDGADHSQSHDSERKRRATLVPFPVTIRSDRIHEIHLPPTSPLPGNESPGTNSGVPTETIALSGGSPQRPDSPTPMHTSVQNATTSREDHPLQPPLEDTEPFHLTTTIRNPTRRDDTGNSGSASSCSTTPSPSKDRSGITQSDVPRTTAAEYSSPENIAIRPGLGLSEKATNVESLSGAAFGNPISSVNGGTTLDKGSTPRDAFGGSDPELQDNSSYGGSQLGGKVGNPTTSDLSDNALVEKPDVSSGVESESPTSSKLSGSTLGRSPGPSPMGGFGSPTGSDLSSSTHVGSPDRTGQASSITSEDQDSPRSSAIWAEEYFGTGIGDNGWIRSVFSQAEALDERIRTQAPMHLIFGDPESAPLIHDYMSPQDSPNSVTSEVLSTEEIVELAASQSRTRAANLELHRKVIGLEQELRQTKTRHEVILQRFGITARDCIEPIWEVDEDGRQTRPLYDDIPNILRESNVNILLARTHVKFMLADYNEMIVNAEHALAIAERLRYPPLCARCHYFMGIASYHKHRFTNAWEKFELSLNCSDKYGISLENIQKWLKTVEAAVANETLTNAHFPYPAETPEIPTQDTTTAYRGDTFFAKAVTIPDDTRKRDIVKILKAKQSEGQKGE